MRPSPRTDPALRSVHTLLGFGLRARDGEIGRVHDVYFDDHRWAVRYLVVDTRDWLGGRRVLISPISALGTDWARRKLNLDLTREQVRNSPDVDTDKPVSRQHEIELHEYFAFPFYWTGGELWGSVPYPGILRTPDPKPHARPRPSPEPAATSDADPHLRSARAVTGYFVQAVDDEIGHVEDFLLDSLSWAIRWLVVDTRNVLPGKRVLVSPARIMWVSWLELKVHIGLSRTTIENAPPYDPSRPPTPEDEARLAAYYDRPQR